MSSLLPLLTVALLLCAGCSNAAPSCGNCGNTSVPYPLSTGTNCGDQSYKVRCTTAGELWFDTLNSTYLIEFINPSTQRFVIRPASFAGNTCITTDFNSQGIQLNSSLPFNVTSSNTIFFLNCSNLLLGSPLNCSSTSLCHSYINGSSDAKACEQAGLCCSFRAGGSTTSYSIRVQKQGCMAYRSFVNLDYSLPVSEWPSPGVEIQWMSPPEPVCQSQADCGQTSNSTCKVDPSTSGVKRCFCDARFSWDPIHGSCVNNATCQISGGCGSTNRTPLIAGLTGGLGATLLVAVLGTLIYRRHRHIKEAQERLAKEREDILNANSSGKSAKIFSGKELKRSTNNFSEERLLGSGGYGEVYKGILKDGTIIAVKCAKLGNTKGVDQVLNEVRILCQVNHRSLVRLLGCCVELDQPLMVYEYISNGTLYDHLHTLNPGIRSELTWLRRLSIALQTAEGLAYLHSSAVPPIYHRDVKSSNILLDEKMNAKVSDFGLSRLAETDLSHVSTCAQGTLGYLDPEYYRNYQLTDKSDVYSFGVVLLELLTSQKAIDFNRGPDDVNLAVYVQRKVDEEKLMETIDPMLTENATKRDLETFKALAFLALGCLEERRQNRPSMKEIAEEIDYIMSIASGVVKEV